MQQKEDEQKRRLQELQESNEVRFELAEMNSCHFILNLNNEMMWWMTQEESDDNQALFLDSPGQTEGRERDGGTTKEKRRGRKCQNPWATAKQCSKFDSEHLLTSDWVLQLV